MSVPYVGTDFKDIVLLFQLQTLERSCNIYGWGTDDRSRWDL